ncbi:MAG TPA: hypothetical protein VK484_10915 [Ferruginibacter sp.]|nr:hypothetical protein [Ferruginibacter sp.]
MKRTVGVCLLLVVMFNTHAQQTAADCNCPTPKGVKFLNFCTLVENQDSRYKQQLREMSCVDLTKDSPETILAKVQCMWRRFFAEFGCDDSGFLVPQGNILKYAVNQEFEYFVDGVVEEFDLDINLKDPADGKTLLDFVLDEVARYKKNPEYQKKAKELQEIYDHFKFDLYALHANELTSKPHYQSGVKINLAENIKKKYTGAYALNKAPTNVYTVVFENDKLLMSLNGSKRSELHAESENTFFLIPKNATRYRFTINKEGKYDLTFGNQNKATRVN